jgi:hypothetical protein
MCKLFQFPGFYGALVGVGLLAVAWFLAWLRTKPLKEGGSYQFDTPGEKGSFASLLSSYLDVAKFVLGLASGTIVLLVGSATFRAGGAGNLLASFASPLFLLALSILYGVFFMALMIFDYEGYRQNTKRYTRVKYSRNLALGFSCLFSFSVGYLWLVAVVIRQS